MCFKVLTGAKRNKNEKAMKAACAFKSAHPHFVTTCRTSRSSYMVCGVNPFFFLFPISLFDSFFWLTNIDCFLCSRSLLNL